MGRALFPKPLNETTGPRGVERGWLWATQVELNHTSSGKWVKCTLEQCIVKTVGHKTTISVIGA